MSKAFCFMCSRLHNGYVRHDWPPCDLNADGTAKNPLECGHRRCFLTPTGVCAECLRLAENRKRAKRVIGRDESRVREALLRIAARADDLSGPCIRAHVADALGMTVKELEQALAKGAE